MQKEEAWRNSAMSDMLFVSVSHTLSPYIFSLDDRCKQMSEGDRVLVKERIDPSASGGMNGYLSLCAGDTCPPVFNSPIQGMENIMNNQVICAIYTLPDAHEHITRPPIGVVFPEKTVNLDDVKPEPTLWHEDTGRKPFDNGRNNNNNNNANGTISGQHLGQAAHRLISNSLQIRDERNNPQAVHGYSPHPRHAAGYESHPRYPNNQYNAPERGRVEASSGYSQHRHSISAAYGQSYAPPPSGPIPRYPNLPIDSNGMYPHWRDPHTGYHGQGLPRSEYHYGGQMQTPPGVYYDQPGRYENAEDGYTGREHGYVRYDHDVRLPAPDGGRGFNYPPQRSNNHFSNLRQDRNRERPHWDQGR
ncbi:hypothetical protein M569_01916 [Genlisea aurea]|uniref:Xrn1 helical domain-containing protein n=1 Tax=Genlisea aurea TaxID=192259 RepID=S8D641_9LAMI|nr:hypothetical protein M569_01916 [Genlisea aurea]